MQAILATIQEAQTSKGCFISLYDDLMGPTRGLGLATFYLTEERGIQDLRINEDILNKLEWLKGVIEFIQMLQKH